MISLHPMLPPAAVDPRATVPEAAAEDSSGPADGELQQMLDWLEALGFETAAFAPAEAAEPDVEQVPDALVSAAVTSGNPLPPGGNDQPAEPRPRMLPLIDVAHRLRSPVGDPGVAVILERAEQDTEGADVDTRRSSLEAMTQSLQTAAAQATARAPAATPVLSPSLDLRSGEPATPLGRQLQWMVQQGVHSARIRVHPEQLGAIDIRLRVDGDNAQLAFTSPNAQVREILEQSIPRLRETLAEAGIVLDEAHVGSGEPEAQARQGGYGGDADATASSDDADANTVTQAVQPPRSTQRLLDTYA